MTPPVTHPRYLAYRGVVEETQGSVVIVRWETCHGRPVSDAERATLGCVFDAADVLPVVEYEKAKTPA